MARESILFVNSNYKPVLERLQSLYTVYNYRDAEGRDALSRVELIVLASNGYERIDLAKASKRDIRITNTPNRPPATSPIWR